MVRLQTIRLAIGLAALMVTVGCQHHRHQQCCPCSCASAAQPVATTPPAKPAVLNPVPMEPTVRSAVGIPN